uniref:Uncharacterized protein n=1 Tax=Rhizophora mucronata TaxID=61149 RepID=A0A2P2NNI3_RHIMU
MRLLEYSITIPPYISIPEKIQVSYAPQLCSR